VVEVDGHCPTKRSNEYCALRTRCRCSVRVRVCGLRVSSPRWRDQPCLRRQARLSAFKSPSLCVNQFFKTPHFDTPSAFSLNRDSCCDPSTGYDYQLNDRPYIVYSDARSHRKASEPHPMGQDLRTITGPQWIELGSGNPRDRLRLSVSPVERDTASLPPALRPNQYCPAASLRDESWAELLNPLFSTAARPRKATKDSLEVCLAVHRRIAHVSLSYYFP
jgi:hypothetical protein